VTRELAFVGLVAGLFGLGAYYATGQLAPFSWLNLALGAAALLASLALGARRLRSAGGRDARRVAIRGALRIAAACALAAGLERAAASAHVRLDWTFERRYELAPATRKALHELPGRLEALLFYDPLDPRRRQTRLLLQSLAREGDVRVGELPLDAAQDDVDRYEVGGSNTVVLVVGDRFETVDRPTEGALYEALYRLRARETGALAFLTGEGEGDLERTDERGYSGLAAALETEGYRIRSVPSAALAELPPETDALVVLAPRRHLLPESLAALRRYLLGGGHLVAFLEPGVESGVEDLLAEFGLRSPNEVVVDPASAELGPTGRGVSPLIYNYETHPTTRGLDPTRMAMLHGARAFELTKPRVEDELRRTVLSSPRAWLSADLSLLTSRQPPPDPADAARGYQALAAAGRYRRDGRETRIVAFGDGDFASNRYLRALYNLDLVLNAVHWATEREPEITLRPKLRTPLNFPIPLANTVQALYGVGLLVPELLLAAGGLVWLRRRRA
jgi:hypothetical protein